MLSASASSLMTNGVTPSATRPPWMIARLPSRTLGSKDGTSGALMSVVPAWMLSVV